jgi:hypothetical protein
MALQLGIRRVAAVPGQQQRMVNVFQNFVAGQQLRPLQLGNRNGTTSTRRVQSMITIQWTNNALSLQGGVRTFMVPAISVVDYSTLPVIRERTSEKCDAEGNVITARSISLNLECGILEEDDDGYVF